MMKHMTILAFLVISMTGMAQQISDYVPAGGLVAYYPFDVNLNDASGAGNDGSGEVAGFDEGKTGQAAVFTGSQIVDLPMSISYPERTVALWARVDADGWQLIFSDDHGGLQNGFSLVGYGHPDLTNSVGAQFGTSSSGRLEVALNSWVHVAAVRRVDSTFYYFNGVLQSAEESGFYHSGGGVPNARIGADRDGGRKFTGAVDELLIYDQCLSEDEILGLYLGETPMMGCTNSAACNFDPDANVDDGSCAELDACGECGGGGVAGCTDGNACNFNPVATCDDGSCEFPVELELGADVLACEPVVLDAGSGFDSYNWNTGATTQTIEVSESGTYAVVVNEAGQHSLRLDGQDDYIQINQDLGPSEGSFSFHGNVRFDHIFINDENPYRYHMILQKGPAPNHGSPWWALRLDRDEPYETSPVIRVNVGGGPQSESLNLVTDAGLEPETWYSVSFVINRDENTLSLYLEGQLVATGALPPGMDTLVNEEMLEIGRHYWSGESATAHYLMGNLKDFSFWSKALSQEEVEQLGACSSIDVFDEDLMAYFPLDSFEGDVVVDASQQGNDGTLFGGAVDDVHPDNGCQLCTASDTISVVLNHGSCYCGEGSVWHEESQECLPVVNSENACQDGTVWSDQHGGCIVANPSDTDFDGCVSMTDLLDLLTVFGTCAEEELEEDPEVAEWSCGDPLEYQGYDYETVQIGGQCWFAENLRAESYRDGDSISGNLSNDDWSTTLQGAVTFYNNAPSPLLEYGRLYNGYATQDPRGLCPQGWQIPSDDDWTVMTNLFGGLDSAGLAMKSLFGWSNDGGGNNSSGFDALPGGSRYNDGVFNGTTYDGYWWSSTLVESTAWFRQLENDKSEVIRQPSGLNYGFSVRCIQDSE